ncbi:MAG TPA: hypothetical protein VKB57_19725 [Acidimicrobiales bacterium]|nr:hypothetical protein [Acidimicrobiales bacterium]
MSVGGGAPHDGLDARWAWAVVGAVGRHPSLWGTAVRQAKVLAAPGWWRRAPFLPLPAPGYLRFRIQTAYGGAGDRPPEPADLVTYLRWCRSVRSVTTR